MILDLGSVWSACVSIIAVIVYSLSAASCVMLCFNYVMDFENNTKRYLNLNLTFFMLLNILLFSVPFVNTWFAFSIFKFGAKNGAKPWS